jgi:hypothetical protein
MSLIGISLKWWSDDVTKKKIRCKITISAHLGAVNVKFSNPLTPQVPRSRPALKSKMERTHHTENWYTETVN